MVIGPRIGVLAVQGDVREHVRALESSRARASTVRRPAELAEVDALVIPGGESTTMDKLVRAFDLFGPLRARLAEGMPAFGSCAGMIMLADRLLGGRPDQQTLGGLDITVRRNAFGRQVDSFEAELTVAGVEGPPVPAVFIRAPWVEQVGAAVTVLARIDADPHPHASHEAPPDLAGRIVAVAQGPLLATSFHPEVTGDHRMHDYFVSIVKDNT